MDKKLIIDADSLSYHGKDIMNKKESEKWLDDKILKIHQISNIDVSNFEFYLTMGKTFRDKLQEDYKGNRCVNNRPEFYKYLKDYLISEYGAIYEEGYEADDLVVDRWKESDDYVLASIDKDLLYNHKGEHLNLYGTMSWVLVSEEESIYNFEKQVFIGDKVDNISSLVKGVGISKLDKIIRNTGICQEDINKSTCKILGIDYNTRLRMLYCGKKMDLVDDYVDDVILNEVNRYVFNKEKIVEKKIWDKFKFGKYKGETFSSVYRNDKKYFDWIIENFDLSDKKNIDLREYCIRKKLIKNL